MSRRTFLLSGLALTCMRRRSPGRLVARPRKSARQLAIGLHPLGFAKRDTYLFVPSATATKLIVMLHGATGAGERVVKRMRPYAESIDAILLAPTSQDSTWDAIGDGDFGRDAAIVDRGLEHVFARAAIDPRHLAIAGFSDGASYALSLGLMNGDLFSHVIAFSPGFVNAPSPVGRPRVFISHGDADEILPIERCGRPIAANLTASGYPVRFREFEGGHGAPPEIAREAMAWLAAS